MAKEKKVKISREELESLIGEMNEVMGLDPEINIKKKDTDEDLIEKIKENAFEDGEVQIYATDFEEDPEDDEKVIFTEEAAETLKKLGIEVDAGEEDPEEKPEEKPAKADKKGKKEEKKEEPAKGKDKKKAEPEPDPEENEMTAEAVGDMDYKELKALVEERELEIDLDDFPKKKVEELREAVLEALELTTELTIEMVNEMDFDELKDLIETQELEIDIDDYSKKKIVKLREAVIEALELEETEEEPEPEEKPAKGKGKKEEKEEPKKGKKEEEKPAKAKAAKKEDKEPRKSREEVFAEFMKGGKVRTKEEMIQNQLDEYGGTENWALYQVNTFIRFMLYFEMMEETKNGYKMIKK